MNNQSLFLFARYKFCKDKLISLPHISRGYRRGLPVYRVRINKKYYAYADIPKNRNKYEAILKLKDRITAKLKKTVAELSDTYKPSSIEAISSQLQFITTKNNLMDKQFYDTLIDNSSNFKNDKNYYLNGYNFRSRAEQLIADVLRDMKLPFKYECNLYFDNDRVNVDFVVYVEEFDCCFIIEYLGMMNDYKYQNRTANKQNLFYANGLYPYRNILFLYGDENNMPSEFEIRSAITHILNVIASRHIIEAA